MSQRRARRLKFFAANPLCCFCGGQAPAVEEDHVPARSFFNQRVWPVGYVYPACSACNGETALDEQAIAMLSRIYPDPVTGAEKAETLKLMAEVQNNHPHLFREMHPSLRQLRDARSKYGLAPEPGESLTTLPVLSVSGPLLNTALQQFSRKLFCTLFYKHSGSILGPDGGIAMRWYTNIQIDADEINRTLAAVTPFAPKLERNTVGLNDQFFYRWGVADTNRMAAFLAFFRKSFAILGVVSQDPVTLPSSDNRVVLQPFRHMWRRDP
jgi:hypothetical protein